ncbi:MAG: peptide deformylase [Magnetococcales bacterium]|nr:peptide deformylase [Magnetococcales bacterium]
MARLTILTAPDKRLKQKSLPVLEVDGSVRRLMDDMLETMYAAPGIGLAAPQVGVLRRVIVVDVANKREMEPPNPLFLANPEIIVRDGVTTYEEGCLSVPETIYEVARAASITVKALDRQGNPLYLEAEGLLAICLQHEIDHLDGILFIDHISRLKREMVLRRLRKRQLEEGR